MTLSKSSTLFLISLTLFLVELIVFFRLKKKIGSGQFDDNRIGQLAHLVKMVTTEHLLIYSLTYFIGLFICRFIPFLFSILITLQLISLSVHIYLYLNLRKR